MCVVVDQWGTVEEDHLALLMMLLSWWCCFHFLRGLSVLKERYWDGRGEKWVAGIRNWTGLCGLISHQDTLPFSSRIWQVEKRNSVYVCVVICGSWSCFRWRWGCLETGSPFIILFLIAGTLAGAKVMGESCLLFRVPSLTRGSNGRFRHFERIRCFRCLIFQLGWARNHWSYGTSMRASVLT